MTSRVWNEGDPEPTDRPAGVDDKLLGRLQKSRRESALRAEDEILLAWYDANCATKTGNPDGDRFLRAAWLSDLRRYEPECVRKILAGEDPS